MYYLSKRIFINESTGFTPAQDSVFEEILKKSEKTIRRLSILNIDIEPLLYLNFLKVEKTMNTNIRHFTKS